MEVFLKKKSNNYFVIPATIKAMIINDSTYAQCIQKLGGNRSSKRNGIINEEGQKSAQKFLLQRKMLLTAVHELIKTPTFSRNFRY